MVTAITAPDLRKLVMELGISTIANSPREFSDVIRSDMARWGKLIRSLNQPG